MKKILVGLIILAMVLTVFSIDVFNSVQADSSTCHWEEINNGLYGGTVNCMAIDPLNSDRMYAGTQNGVYKSTDSGLTWESTVLKNRSIYSIQIDPDNTKMIYATTDDGIYLSINYGEDWTCIGSTTGKVTSVALDPINSTNIYAGLCGGIFVKKDSSDWVSITNNLSNNCIQTIAINPTNPNIIFVGTGNTLNFEGDFTWGGIFMTKNGGVSWNQVEKNLINNGVFTLVFDKKNADIIYAGTEFGIFKSTDGGTTYSEINNGLNVGTANTIVHSIAINPKDNQIIYAGTSKGVFKSTNGGASWVQKNSGLSSTLVNCIVINPSNPETIYAGMQGSGIFKSLDEGGGWIPINNGLDAVMVETLEVDFFNPKNIYVGTNGSGLFKSTDGGQNWQAINNGLTLGGDNSDWYPLIIFSIVLDYKDSQIVYLGTNRGIFKSINGGAIWVPTNSGLTTKYVTSILIDPTDNKVLYAGTNDFLFKSTDQGNSWKHISEGSQSQSQENTIIHSIAIDPNNNKIIYVGTNKGVLKSATGGISWSQINVGLSNKSVYPIAINFSYSNTLYAGTGDGLFKTTNGGESWKQLPNPALALGFSEVSVNSILIDPENPETLYIGTDHGVFQSKDEGSTWLNFSLEFWVINSIVSSKGSDNFLYAGTNSGGVFKYICSHIAPPQNLQANTSNSSITLSWSSSTQSTYPVAGYAIYRGIYSDGESSTPIGTVGASTTTYTDTDATANIMYYYYVKAFDNQSPANYSEPSNEVSAKITDTAPPNISISYPTYNTTVETDSITVTGTATDSESGIDRVLVNSNEVYVSSNGSFSTTVHLTEGYNTITVTAYDKAENKTTTTLTVAYTNPSSKTVLILQINNKLMMVKKNSETISKIMDVAPIIIEGRTLLPIRWIAEPLGASVNWDATENKVTVSLGNEFIELWIGKNTALVNGTSTLIDSSNPKVVPVIINGRTMIPVRFVTENLGATVNWDPLTKTVTITYSG